MQHRKDNYTGNTRLHERKCAEQRRRRSDIGSLIVSKERQESRNRKWKTRRITWERRLFFVPSRRNFTKQLHERTESLISLRIYSESCVASSCVCVALKVTGKEGARKGVTQSMESTNIKTRKSAWNSQQRQPREKQNQRNIREIVCVYTAVVAKLQWIRGNKRTVVSGRKKEKKSSSWKVVVTRRWWWRWRRGKIFLLPLLVSLLRRQEVDF